jgi:hypothetical protein
LLSEIATQITCVNEPLMDLKGVFRLARIVRENARDIALHIAFLKGYLNRRENNKYLSLAMVMAILKRWEIFY